MIVGIRHLLSRDHFFKLYKNKYGCQLRYYFNGMMTNLKTGGYYHGEDLIYKESGIVQNVLSFYIKNYIRNDYSLDNLINKLEDDYNIITTRKVASDGYYYNFKKGE